MFSRFSLGPLRKPVVGQTAAVAFLAIAIFAFTLYAPLTYGNQWTQDQCKKVKVFDTWDWDCNTFYPTYDDYVNAPSSVDSHIPASAAPIGGQPEAPKNDAQVTPQAENLPPPAAAAPADGKGGHVVGREEKVEYRDEQGNLLNDEQVAELKGKVSFQTRYETRTRIIDADGHELYNGAADMVPESLRQQVAPPHPDVEGQNPETGNASAEQPSAQPPKVEVESDVEKEKSIAEAETTAAKPAGEGNEATSKQEL